MKSKSQIVVISGILVLLATAATATASYIAQPAEAACDSSGNTPYGQGCVSQNQIPIYTVVIPVSKVLEELFQV